MNYLFQLIFSGVWFSWIRNIAIVLVLIVVLFIWDLFSLVSSSVSLPIRRLNQYADDATSATFSY